MHYIVDTARGLSSSSPPKSVFTILAYPVKPWKVLRPIEVTRIRGRISESINSECFILDDGKWKVIAENIDHEAWVVHDLKSSTNYQFRLLAMNKIGWSIPGFPTNNVTTKMTGI